MLPQRFVKTLIDDHSKGKAEASSVAEKLGIAPLDGVAPEAEQELAKLQRLSGVSFDQEFARYMVEDHEKDIPKYREEAAHGGADAKRLAEKTLPVLEKHLQMANALQAGKQPGQ
jgi:putative membrane protein